MAETFIDALPAASAVTANHTLPADNAPTGATVTQKITVAQILVYILNNITGAEWGQISGTLADQTDLVVALAGKANNNFRQEDYSGVAPTWAPTGTNALGIAVDTSTERVWWYYAGAWH